MVLSAVDLIAQPNPPTLREQTMCEMLAEGQSVAAVARRMDTTSLSIRKQIMRGPVNAYLIELQKEMRQQSKTSRDDVLLGIRQTIQTATDSGDLPVQLKGWIELSKMLGYYAPDKKEVVIDDKSGLLQQLSKLNQEDLLELAGNSVIDGDFWEEIDGGG